MVLATPAWQGLIVIAQYGQPSNAKAKYDEAHAHAHHLYKEWMQERDRYFCVHCFKPMFLDVLVERLKGIAGSIISDINKMQEDKP